MKILIVEDEAHIADGLRFNIEAEGFEAFIAEDGETALAMISKDNYDAIVLDVMLPNISGFDVAAQLRSQQNFTPILMLTARGRSEDVLKGFETGADDYLAKPFDLNIFLARLNGLLRRNEWSRREATRELGDRIEINGKTIDFANLELISNGETIHLTMMEIKLLRYLIEHKGMAVSRNTLLEEVWGLQEDTDTRAIDNFIVRLRRYLENKPNDPSILRTVRGVGYRFVLPEDKEAK